jgi:beta-lactamase regulating signal transducer with metallopeptidase domain
MNIELNNIVATILGLGFVGVVGYVAKFLGAVDRRLTRIETLLEIKHGKKNEDEDDD